MLGVVKSRILRILSLNFSGVITNAIEATAPYTNYVVDGGTNIAGGVFNLNNTSTCSLKLSQIGGANWFNLQRDFDLSFNLVVATASRADGEIVTIEDPSENSVFRFELSSGNFRLLHGGSPNFTVAVNSGYTVPRDVSLAILIEYRRTSVVLKVNGVTVINATGWLQRTDLTRDLWLGGSGATDTILGSLDNVEMILL